MNRIKTHFLRDRRVWDSCAETYERQIVGGHPDITAFETFEEDFLDHLLRFLAKNQKRPIKLMDIGCGSGRLHLRYGTMTSPVDGNLHNQKITKARDSNFKLDHDPLLSKKLREVWGIDFSNKMIEIARRKIEYYGLDQTQSTKLSFEQGSAFELQPQGSGILPVVVCLVNSIGVMQGPEGAMALFKSIRRALESSGGIGIISCYQQEYLKSYGLGQYESTMDVSGQPSWVMPDSYATPEYIQVPRCYKKAYDDNPEVKVDVFDHHGQIVKKGHCLIRDPERTAQVLKSGHISTFSDYESNWYSFRQMDEWIQQLWPPTALHIKTKDLDMERAEPAQMAILDYQGQLDSFFEIWFSTK